MQLGTFKKTAKRESSPCRRLSFSNWRNRLSGSGPERLNEVADAVGQMWFKAIDTDKSTEIAAVA